MTHQVYLEVRSTQLYIQRSVFMIGDPDPAQSEPISHNHAIRCMELVNDRRLRTIGVPNPKDKVWPETET
jgi:hypothetical protein